MNSRYVAVDYDPASILQLKPFYDSRMIPAEKKPFLVDLARSFGSNLAVDGDDTFINDACSQIATAGLGFNASPLFAPCQHLESWTGDYTTANIQSIADAFRRLLIRMLGASAMGYHVHFCASGTEAIEISLGVCFENRVNRKGRKVLAFEGSFHGRMLVALSATWNPKKREPFAWPDCQSDFVPYPTVYPASSFELGAAEFKVLAEIREKLATGEYFAILIEPMQCEGGDRYSSPGFHQQLAKLAREFDVPLVYDEVQTGFHLGDHFFWHSQFDLRDSLGEPFAPDAIACAKKAQTGVVISKQAVPYRESFCPASLIRGYATASMIGQYNDRVLQLGETVRNTLAALIVKYESLIGNPRSQGMAFAFDFHDVETLNRFVNCRFRHGLLFYPAGEKTVRFRLNLSTDPSDMLLLFRQLDRSLADAAGMKTDFPDAVSVLSIESDTTASAYRFQCDLADSKRKRCLQIQPDTTTAIAYLQNEIREWESPETFEVVVLNVKNWSLWREQILQIQELAYEPVRRTPAVEFDVLFKNDNLIESPAILLTTGKKIAGMAFCGPLASFPQLRGVTEDPYFTDDRTFYMLDLTVAAEFRGCGLGRMLKNALTLLAAERGVHAIHGRNRERLARAMWAINLSLGSFELKHLADDYPDEKSWRDCTYYRCPLVWRSCQYAAKLPFAPLDIKRIDADYFSRNAPALVNKICLSNFVTRSFLEDLKTVSQTLPESLRHIYTASSLSESVDKVAKAIWLKRQPRTGLLTVAGHYFGEGSFLARSLSDIGDPWFDVTRIPDEDVLTGLAGQLKEDGWLAFFVETRCWIDRMDLLAECIRLCRHAGVPIVFNETGPQFGSGEQASRKLDTRFDLLPDAGVAWLGGQMSLTYTNDFLFADDPLLLISTWDGDAYALARFAETMKLSEIVY